MIKERRFIIGFLVAALFWVVLGFIYLRLASVDPSMLGVGVGLWSLGLGFFALYIAASSSIRARESDQRLHTLADQIMERVIQAIIKNTDKDKLGGQ